MTGMEGSLGRAVDAPHMHEAERVAFVRTLIVSGILIVALWLAAMSRWILTDSVVPWDSKNQFYAFYRFLAESFHAGTSPFWNPYHYGGHPSIADPQSLVFAPLMVLYALFEPAPSLRSFDLLVHAHLLIGGLSVAAIGARARWPIVACVLGAAVFMFGGAAAGRLQHTGIILSYGLFPLALLLLQLAFERRSYVIAVAFAGVAAAVALGRNQVAMLLCFALAAFAIAAIAQPAAGRERRQRLAVAGVMAVVGGVLIAVPMLLTMQFAALSNRPAVTLDQAMLGSLHPAGLAQLVVANIFGSHRNDYWGPNATTEPLVALTDDSFNYVFVGAVPIVLLLWLGVAGGWAFRRGRVLVFAIAALALLYALGRYTPFFAVAFEWIPGVSRFRRPVDASFVFVAALALLSGVLLTDYIRKGIPRRSLWSGLAVAVATLIVVGAGVVFSARVGHSGDALMAALASMPVAAAAILILAFARGERKRGVAAIAVTAIAVGELVWWNAGFRLNAEPRYVYGVLERPFGAAAEVLDLIDRAMGERRRMGERPRIEVVGLGGPWQNLAMVRSLEAVNGYNPLRIGTYDRLVAPGESNWRIDLRDFPASFDGFDCALARTLGLEFLLLGRPIEEVPHLLRQPVADVLRAGPDIWVYRLKNPEPRLKFSRRVQVADADALSGPGWLAASPSPDRVLIDDDTPPAASYAGAMAGAAGQARIVSWRSSAVEIEVDSELGGVLALHDSWYPGWVAEIGGKRVPILRADVLFRGVEVPRGRHRVTFSYVPYSLDNLAHALRLALRGRQ